MEKLLERQDRLVYQKPEVRDRNSFLSRNSADEDTCGGRSEDGRDGCSISKTRTNSSKAEKPSKLERVFSDRRDSEGSYRRKSEDNKTHHAGKLEKVGRKEYYQKHSPSQTKYATSPAGSSYTTKSVEHYKRRTSHWLNESSRYLAGNHELAWNKSESELKISEGKSSKAKDLDEETMLNGKEQSESGTQKKLPQNLLDIFNQIAEFEREKGSKQKNQ